MNTNVKPAALGDTAPQDATIDLVTQNRFDTEASLIGALLQGGDHISYRMAVAICGPDHFVDSLNARIFALIGRGVEAGLHAFPLVHYVMSQLRDDPTLREINITASGLVAKYVMQSCPPIGIEGCARQIKHDYLNGLLKLAVEESDTASAESHAAEMERLSRAHLENEEGVVHVGRASEQIVQRVSDLYRDGVAIPDFVHPGSHALADVIQGWRRGRFYVVAGRPGMGKSTTALSWLVHTARRGAGVLFFSLEMTNAELMEIALCDLAWSHNRRIEYRDLSSAITRAADFDERFSAIQEASRELKSYPLTIMDRGGMTIADIRSQVLQQAQRLAAQGKRLEVIAVDHLGLIKPSGKYAGNKVAETEEISAALKALAKELNVAVIALVQLNRAVESREEKRPGLSDLRWSGSIEQDADVVLFIYREEYYLAKPITDMEEDDKRLARLSEVKNRMEVIFAKHRGGPCPTIPFFCDLGCGVVRDSHG